MVSNEKKIFLAEGLVLLVLFISGGLLPPDGFQMFWGELLGEL